MEFKYKIVSAMVLALISAFIGLEGDLIAQYPAYAVLIMFAVLMAREAIKDYGELVQLKKLGLKK